MELMAGLSEGLVFVDEHLLVLDKPAGLLCVPGRGAGKEDCLAARAQALWPDARIVHRLDMATSGLVAMARGAEMERRLSIAFQQRRVHKRYVAIVAGRLRAAGWQEIALPLIADWPNRPNQKVDLAHGKPSLTRWRVLENMQDATRVELEPVTGRSHQLRVHLQAIGHPILGDALYAPAELRARAPRLLLHAAHLELPHPHSGDAIAFDSQVPF
jgi:tRNA pseudouridine32 synthase/23S rRNA pseudouridine746 synthase